MYFTLALLEKDLSYDFKVVKEKSFLVNGILPIKWIFLFGNKKERKIASGVDLVDLARTEEFGNCQSY